MAANGSFINRRRRRNKNTTKQPTVGKEANEYNKKKKVVKKYSRDAVKREKAGRYLEG